VADALGGGAEHAGSKTLSRRVTPLRPFGGRFDEPDERNRLLGSGFLALAAVGIMLHFEFAAIETVGEN
jgi:hypothetical protein